MFDTRFNFYGTMIIFSLVANIIIVLLTYKKYNFTRDEIIGAIVYENLGIILGAKFLTFLEHINLSIEFDLLKLGLSSYGGLIGAIVCLIIFALQFKKSIKEILFIFILPIPLMYSIGKIGCFLVGCCHGIKYNHIGSVIYNHSLDATKGVHYFPVQLVESIVFLLIFIYIFKLTKKENLSWKIFGLTFSLCGFAKFMLEFLRESHVGKIVSFTQIISIIFTMIGLTIIYRSKKEIT